MNGARAAARVVALAATCVVFSLFSCGRAPVADKADDIAPSESAEFPVVVRDELGRKVEIARAPRRIIALLPSHTETLFALGVGDRVVGVDDYSDYPAAATARLTKLGGIYDARLEVLASLEPDLVLAAESSRAVPPLEKMGIAVWAGSAKKFDDVFQVIEVIGRLVGRAARAKDLTRSMRERIAALDESRRAAANAPDATGRANDRPTVYFELDPTPFAVGPSSFVGSLLALAGGANIVPPELGEFPKLSPEWVIARDPEVIVGVSREELMRRPGWSAIAAVRTGRVYVLSSEERQTVVRPGPRLAEGVRTLAGFLHPGT